MVFRYEKVLSYIGYKSGNTLVFTGVNGLSDREMAYFIYGDHDIEIPDNLKNVVNNLEDLKMVEILVRTKLSSHHCALNTYGTIYKIRLPKGNSHKAINLTKQL